MTHTQLEHSCAGVGYKWCSSCYAQCTTVFTRMFTRLRTLLYRTLRRSERYTKTDMVFLSKGASWLSVGYGVSVAMGFLLSIAYANLLPPEQFGTYKYILALVGAVGAFSLFNMGPAISRAVARGYEGALDQAVRASLITNAFAIVLAGGIGTYYLIKDDPVFGWGVLIAGTLMPLMNSLSFSGSFLNGKGLIREQTMAALLRNSLPTLIVIATIAVTDSVLAIVLAYCLSSTLIVALLLWRVKRRYQITTNRDPEAIRYGAHLSLMEIPQRLSGHLEGILLFQLLGPASLALVSFARSPVVELRRINTIPRTLILPRFSKRSLPEIRRTIGRKYLIYLMVCGVVVALYALAAPTLFALFFPQYLEAVPYTQVLALSLLALPDSLFSKALIAHAKKRPLYITKSVLPAIRITLLLVLLPLGGIWGLVAVVLIDHGLHMCLNAFFFYRAAASATMQPNA